LELGPDHYDEAYRADPADIYGADAAENKLADLLWRPALAMAEGAVFDVGCGPGHLGQLALAEGMTFQGGLDFSEHAVELARERCPGARFWVLDATSEEAAAVLADPGYRTALVLEVLEHVYHDLLILSAVPEGRLVVFSVPNFHTRGHVRWFETLGSVLDRYGPFVHPDAIRVTGRARQRNRWWIVAGTRTGRKTCATDSTSFPCSRSSGYAREER